MPTPLLDLVILTLNLYPKPLVITVCPGRASSTGDSFLRQEFSLSGCRVHNGFFGPVVSRRVEDFRVWGRFV